MSSEAQVEAASHSLVLRSLSLPLLQIPRWLKKADRFRERRSAMCVVPQLHMKGLPVYLK